MKKLTSEQMMIIEGGQTSITWSRTYNGGDLSALTRTIQSPLHYSGWDCVGFVSGLLGMGFAAAGTGGLAILGGLVAFGGFVAAAGNCEGWLNS